MKHLDVEMCVLSLHLPLTSSCLSVLFVISIFPNVWIPSSPNSVTVVISKTVKNMMNGSHVCIQPISSFVSVVFDIKASQTAFAPVSLISVPVHLVQKWGGKACFSFVCRLLLMFLTTQIEFCECRVYL